MTDRPCPVDGTALPPGAVICAGCTTRTRLLLREVPDLLDQLDLTISRQTSMPAAGGIVRCGRDDCSHDPDEPGCVAGVRLDLDVRASDARLALTTCLHGWARVWDDETPVLRQLPGLRKLRDHVISDTPSQARTLAAVPDLGSRPWAADVAREIRAAVDEGWRAVDRPPDLTVVGRCPECAHTLYGPADADLVRCTNCSGTFGRVDVREASLSESRVLLTAAQLGTALADGDAEAADRIAASVRKWRQRGLITVVRNNLKGQPLYRVADVQKLLSRVDPKEIGA
jgi:hypothetical protein